MIRLNEPAPDFSARSTQGRLQLSDFKGRWVVLFSHPADFTPVCTSEFLGFARHFQEFDAIQCSLLGLSVDSVYSHIAWVRNIEERFAVQIPFPIIEDLNHQVSALYGMIQPAASEQTAVRALFVIDPEGILRAMLYYPLQSGRSVTEVLRLVRAIQAADTEDAGTPEGWQPNDPVIEEAPSTLDQVSARMEQAADHGLDCADWYFCKRSSQKPKKAA